MKSYRLATVAAALAAVAGLGLGGAGVAAAQEAAATSYVALGDSYSSGVGAGSYDSASGSCKRSANAYPVLWKNANSPASFHFTACSGAKTTDVVNNQLGPLNSGTTLVSITVGGNDAGFADTMTACVLGGESTCLSRVAQAREYIAGTLPGRLDAVYDAIRAKAPNAEVAVLNYPRFYKLGGSCLVGLSERSRAAINAAADHLSEVIAKRAADHGFTFGDVRGPFTGHEICSGDSWLHSVDWLNITNSYHPKAAGQSGGYYPVLERLA
ncbi:SGNH/GDSL hydrolase family protein [Streptomyces sp. TRM 70361]|uniref:SGNH/GDSL hydrolase family protein n=1 Tax=Streptomyces sp. TRM 70361 TaxID=3116553 RepID=UPI002E7B0934|nr:SGNH/GDSL hydrolase family protein [Streptomyces sp. TRM 70361]MEE1940715.1 SGNH/GDSL hydrolase family protein [Streptomyces sp. TRM 70361]